MEERLIAFVIWAIMGVLFIAMGIYDLNSKKAKPFGFWANAEVAPIEDAKGYNRALGILWCVYGVLFTLIGLPLLDEQNSGLIILSILCAMLISIAAIVVYVVGIEPKYRKRNRWKYSVILRDEFQTSVEFINKQLIIYERTYRYYPQLPSKCYQHR